MNKRLRPLSYFLILALLAVCSTAAIAQVNHKSPRAGKPHESSGARHHRDAALKKTGHAKKGGEVARRRDPPPTAAVSESRLLRSRPISRR